MKRAYLTTGAVGVMLLGVQAVAQTKTPTAFDNLKGLAGTWEGTSPHGGGLTNSIHLVSDGTAIEESFQSEQHQAMVTLYSADGDRIAMTHYCSIGNQPRMETSSVDANAKRFAFDFVGATNLKDPADMHMHHLVLEVKDPDHFSETWTMASNGKEMESKIDFVRKR